MLPLLRVSAAVRVRAFGRLHNLRCPPHSSAAALHNLRCPPYSSAAALHTAAPSPRLHFFERPLTPRQRRLDALARQRRMAATAADIAERALVPGDPSRVHAMDCRTGKAAADPRQTDLVVYHADCPDGFAAAFAAWKLLGDAAEYVPAPHGPAAPLDLDVTGRRVVVADYCFPAAVTARMIAQAASFIVLDHHASAEKELAGVEERYKAFSMVQSGATLAWCYFHGHEAPVPPLLRYIEDRDLWRWTMPHAAEFCAGFGAPIGDFAAWDAALAGGEAALRACMVKGAHVLEHKARERDAHVARAVPATMRAAPHLSARLVNATTLASEIGNALATQPGVDFGVMWSYNHEQRCFTVSLRSARDDVDVSAIAKAHGGGGHPRAAGFSHLGASIEELFTHIAGRPVAPPPGAGAGAAGAGSA
jgi:hypothetical protein